MKSSKLRKITREFNRYRAPECIAKTLKNEEDKLLILFSGTFSFSCCFDEHFEDYRRMLKDANENYKIEKVIKERNSFIVLYQKLSNTACNSL
ncbi:MAG: hypothetical protein QW673_02635 [Candidatus Thermoplasmatota archaeon]